MKGCCNVATNKDMQIENIAELDALLESTDRKLAVMDEQLKTVESDLRSMLDDITATQNDCLEMADCLARLRKSAGQLQKETQKIGKIRKGR